MPSCSSGRHRSARRPWPSIWPPVSCAPIRTRRSGPCRACRACRLVATGNHPDLHRLAPEGAGGQVVIGDPRDARAARGVRDVLARAGVPAGRGRGPGRDRRGRVERMNEDAQNALLKTLEEPRARGHDRPVRRPRRAAPADGPLALRAGPARTDERARDRGARGRARARRRPDRRSARPDRRRPTRRSP